MDRAGFVTGSFFLFRIMMYLCYRKQGKRRLVVKPVHLNFNYWKRTEKAGSNISIFYCMGGGLSFSVYLFLQQATCHHEEDYKQARPECSFPES